MSSVAGVPVAGVTTGTSVAPAFLKGHGTQNDFIVLLDPDAKFGLSERQAWALCDRRQGLGADGVLRAVPADSGGWFMDYRNADGTTELFVYDGQQLQSMTDRQARTFNYTYTDKGQIWEIRAGGGAVLDKYEYDTAGRMTKWTTPDAELTFENFDMENRPRRTTQTRHRVHTQNRPQYHATN